MILDTKPACAKNERIWLRQLVTVSHSFREEVLTEFVTTYWPRLLYVTRCSPLRSRTVSTVEHSQVEQQHLQLRLRLTLTSRPSLVLSFVVFGLVSLGQADQSFAAGLQELHSKVDSRAADEQLQLFFDQHCLHCHDADSAEAEIDLSPEAMNEQIEFSHLQRIRDVLQQGDMPPPDEPQPTSTAIESSLELLSEKLKRLSPPTTALRRLNRFEYEKTVQDLLRIETPLQDLLPEDNSVQGFDNVSDGLGISAVLMERYLEASNVALDGVIKRVRPLPPQTRRSVLVQQKDNIDSIAQKKGGVIESEGAFIDFTPGWPPARNDDARPVDDGIYRCRIAVWPYEPGESRTIAVAVFVGPLFGDGKRRLAGIFDATGSPDDPRVIEFTTHMNAEDALHILPWIYPEHVTWRDKDEARPGVAIAWAETHGPLDQDFPSKATNNLFGTVDSIELEEIGTRWMRHRKNVKEHGLTSSRPREDAERIVREFVPRAFRRPVPDELVEPFVALTLRRLDQGSSFEQAVRAGVSAVLCSPYFLLINYESEVDDYTLATRLSYFLWSSLPDSRLLSLAEQGKLSQKEVLHAEVERMLDDPKSERFVGHFTEQWLDLNEIEFTTPDKILYPEYDELLLRSMVAETQGFFRELLARDLSIMNFVDSDFAFINQRLASHYGIEGVTGHEQFRIVSLPDSSVRGGLLTHASILKVTANGTNSSPVVRGAWVLDNLLGEPSPPPPSGVPAVEPDIRGATTIREQLDLHRADSSCARCHRKIDPPGFALEEFDVIGGHRSWYRSLGERGKRVSKTRYRVGPQVDSSGTFASGQTFQSFEEFRQYLLEDPDRIARAVASKLLVYSSGRPMSPIDEASVEKVVAKTRDGNFGLRSMIHAVVESEMFRRP